MCILTDLFPLPPPRRTLACYAGGAPKTPHFHGNISFLRNDKQARKSKERWFQYSSAL